MAATGEVKLLDMLLVIFFTLGMFAAAKLIAEHLRGYQREVKATDFYTVSFIALLLLCALLHRFGINVMYSAFLVGYIVKAVSYYFLIKSFKLGKGYGKINLGDENGWQISM